ncbi:MAG: Ldh family oxidoreductase [Spirochaetales bacterium]|nr:Ldh family oxidoreductase [Spirochaetales bacterium]MCF7939526.1 Ldh family oxidoreductase [Spirochaetales bacterium]
MAEDFVWVDFDLLESFMSDAFQAAGVPREDAQICAEVLITSDKRGIDSHGIGRFKRIYIDRIKDGILNTETNFEVVKDGPTTAVVDGHNGMGHVIGKRAMQTAIDKAKVYGMGMVAVRNSTHYGIAGYYSLMAAEAGMIGITGTNARPSIAPTFGVENMLGTNPLTIGFPTGEDFPFVLDCATSVSQRGKIEEYSRLGKTLPEGWVIGEDGSSKTDPGEVLKALVAGTAALAPLGGIGEETAGHKGYGYATVVEILSAALQNGSFMKDLLGHDAQGNKTPYPLGHFFIAINIEAFLGLETFKQIAGSILQGLRNSRKMPGAERIYTAGEKEHEQWLFRKNRGAKVDSKLQNELIEVRDEFDLDYHFDFED